jgi:tetrahydromethanopterin S-methyltransferase subunit G
LTVILNTKERLTKVETQLQTLTEQLDKIATNHLPHIQTETEQLREEMQKEFTKINSKIDQLQGCNKQKLSGRDKAVVYGSFLTMLGLVLVELIRAAFHLG